MDVVRVTSDTSAKTLATRLLVQAGEHGEAIAQAIGAGAVNGIIKAVGILRQESGENWGCFPDFTTVQGDDGRDLSAIRVVVRKVPTVPQHRPGRAPGGLRNEF